MKRFTILLLSIFFVGLANAQLVVTAEDTIVCTGESAYILASGMDTYSWVPGNNIDATTGDSVNFSTTVAGSFVLTIFGTDTTNNINDTATLTMHVVQSPILNIISSAATDNNFVCIGNSATLTASASGVVITDYVWSADSTLDNDTSMMVTATPITATTYTVTVTGDNGCTASASRQVNVNIAKPIIGLSTPNDVICPGQSTTLTASAGQATFSWSPSATLSSSIGATVTATPTSTTTYTVLARSNGCDTTRSITIEVLSAPIMSHTKNPSTTIRLDETVFIDVDCDVCIGYDWILPNSVLQTTKDTLTVSPNVPGSIDIIVRGEGPNGCKTNEVVNIQVDSSFAGTPFGIADLSNKNAVIYSNGEAINIESESVIESVQLFDLTGKMIASDEPNRTRSMMDASALNSGIYFVIITQNGQQEQFKLYID